jgi:TetR/AcrR family transcriptional regulator, mexJK operon transcriptional repressor
VEPNRTDRKRGAIIAAATTAFLERGYAGTSMDQIAAAASVSKQTVYKQFSDKEQLFTAIILDTMGRANDELVRGATLALEDSDDVETDLIELAHQLISSIWQPEVLRLRRLVIGEADRFPQLGLAYWERGFRAGVDALAASIAVLAERGRLVVHDPRLAAQHLAGLVLWVPLNRVMFAGGTNRPPTAELQHIATTGVRVFLRAYGTSGAQGRQASPARRRRGPRP